MSKQQAQTAEAFAAHQLILDAHSDRAPGHLMQHCVTDAPDTCWPQVGALRERIDELSEDLELARTAAAAAAGHAPAPGSSRTSPAGGVAVTATAAADNQQQQQQPQEQQQQRPPSPGQELSELEVAPVKQVPLMGEDTPLEALHAQV
jgi:hypothetical protein